MSSAHTRFHPAFVFIAIGLWLTLPRIAAAATLSAGGEHTCSVTPSGGVECWGRNDSGQLGNDGDPGVDEPYPVAVIGLPGNDPVTAVDAGTRHTCALTAGGAVFCWGWDVFGQLGDGAGFTNRFHAVPVIGLPGLAAQITVGYSHSCALVNAAVYCWGANFSGQLGDGTTDNRPQPVAMAGLPGPASQIDTGSSHTCAVVQGQVYCWGKGNLGQLGTGATPATAQPSLPVLENASDSPLIDIVSVAAGQNFNCALAANGALYCWGDNGQSQLTNNVGATALKAVAISGLPGTVAAVGAGPNHICVHIGGTLYCWGNNSFGKLGAGSGVLRSGEPTAVSGLPAGDFTAIAGGDDHTCAGTPAGTIYCWGSDLHGQLGLGHLGLYPSPQAVAPQAGYNFTAITAGNVHTCALTVDGAAWCWGDAKNGQLGIDGNLSQDRPLPVAVVLPAGETVNAIEAGERHTCAVFQSAANMSSVRCWGDNQAGQIGNGASGADPVIVPAVTPALSFPSSEGPLSVTAGSSHSCGITPQGAARCWGDDTHGQVGDGGDAAAEPISTPADVAGLGSNVTAIGVGSQHACALLSDGTIRCWGEQANGRLGNGDSTAASILAPPPDAIAAFDGQNLTATAVAAGTAHTCALANGNGINGAVFCWGMDTDGQLGNDDNLAEKNLPTPVLGLDGATVSSSAKALAVGGHHSCIVTVSNVVRCWGRNTEGQLGQSLSNIRSLTPVDVAGLGSLENDIVGLTAGFSHTCALGSNGTAMCWGNNGDGQLGNGALGYSPFPQLRYGSPIPMSIFKNGFESAP